MVYNDNFTNNVTSLDKAIDGLNTASGGFMIVLFLIALWIFVYSRTIDRGNANAFMIASMVVSVIASFFWFASIITWAVLIVPFTMTLIGVIMKGLGNN